MAKRYRLGAQVDLETTTPQDPQITYGSGGESGGPDSSGGDGGPVAAPDDATAGAAPDGVATDDVATDDAATDPRPPTDPRHPPRTSSGPPPRPGAHTGSQTSGGGPTSFAADGINLFLSGGGVRSALGALGVVTRLIETGRWDFVRTVVSVSGGTFTNTVLATLRGQSPDVALAGLMDRLTRNPPLRQFRAFYASVVFAIAMFVLTVHAGYELAHWPVDGMPVIIVCGVLVIASLAVVLVDARRTARDHVLQVLLGFVLILVLGYSSGPHPRLAGMVVAFAGVLTLATVVFFVLGIWITEKVRFALGPLPDWSAMQTDGRIHVFAVTDTENGTPVYVTVRDGTRRVFRSVGSRTQFGGSAAYDLEELEAATISLEETVRAAIALPGLEAPVELITADAELLLSDGGLQGTLASRFDPTAQRQAGLVTDELYSLVVAMGGDVGAQSVVIDGGQFLRKVWWSKLAPRPVIGRITDLIRALLISLDALITHDRGEILRHLETSAGTRHWYLRVTGGRVPDRFTGRDEYPTAVTTRMLELRLSADRVGLFSGFKTCGRECVKAGAFVTWLHECDDQLRGMTDEAAKARLDEFDAWFDALLPPRPPKRLRHPKPASAS
jgi:hypothetical protein